MTDTANSLVAALMLSGCFVAEAMAQNAPAAGQEPPPVADPGTTSQFNCISDKTEYTDTGKRLVYRIALTNRCEQRLKCRVFAYIVTSKGPAQGRATLILAPKSDGAAATKTYDVTIKAIGGMGTVSRECRVII